MKEILRYKNILLALILIVIFVFVIKGSITKYLSALEELKVKMSELEKGKVLIERWNATSQAYDELSQGFFAKDPGLFKSYVEAQTKICGINVSYLSPSRKQESFYTEGSLNLRALADSYASIISFLKSLEAKKVVTENLKIRIEADNKRSIEMALKGFILEEQ